MYTRGSEHPGRGPIGGVPEHSVGRFYMMGTKLWNQKEYRAERFYVVGEERETG